jgi:hypothetical protein
LSLINWQIDKVDLWQEGLCYSSVFTHRSYISSGGAGIGPGPR